MNCRSRKKAEGLLTRYHRHDFPAFFVAQPQLLADPGRLTHRGAVPSPLPAAPEPVARVSAGLPSGRRAQSSRGGRRMTPLWQICTQ